MFERYRCNNWLHAHRVSNDYCREQTRMLFDGGNLCSQLVRYPPICGHYSLCSLVLVIDYDNQIIFLTACIPVTVSACRMVVSNIGTALFLIRLQPSPMTIAICSPAKSVSSLNSSKFMKMLGGPRDPRHLTLSAHHGHSTSTPAVGRRYQCYPSVNQRNKAYRRQGIFHHSVRVI
jgi:hypothetical protein